MDWRLKPAALMTDEELMAIARGGVIKCWSAPLAIRVPKDTLSDSEKPEQRRTDS